MKKMFTCLSCDNQFQESEAKIIRYGTGAVLSAVELFSCPECDSTNIKDNDSGKIQGY